MRSMSSRRASSPTPPLVERAAGGGLPSPLSVPATVVAPEWELT